MRPPWWAWALIGLLFATIAAGTVLPLLADKGGRP